MHCAAHVTAAAHLPPAHPHLPHEARVTRGARGKGLELAEGCTELCGFSVEVEDATGEGQGPAGGGSRVSSRAPTVRWQCAALGQCATWAGFERADGLGRAPELKAEHGYRSNTNTMQ